MHENGNHLALGSAWVTPWGILFEGSYYSCRRALRDGWFEQALSRKPWLVRVAYVTAMGPQGGLYIQSETFDPDHVCQLVDHEANRADVEAYQARLRMLQEERRQLFRK